MSGEHSHPEVADQHASLRADLLAAAAAIRALTARVVALEARPAWDLEYDFLGKPSAPQTIGRTYTRLDLSGFDPAHPGWEHTLRYFNAAPVFQSGKSAGALRPRMVRADGDETFYSDIPIHRDMLDGDGRTLVTQPYWETAEGAPTVIELRCIGGLASVSLSTRYTKKAILHKL
jgi:hypothetical protein